MTHEESIIRTFLHPSLRERYLALLAIPKRRSKLTGLFAHGIELDMRYAIKLPSKQHAVGEIERQLKAKGAPSVCYLFSEDSALDQRELPLSIALAEVVGRGMGTFISCIPGKLAYFEGEEVGERYILWAAA